MIPESPACLAATGSRVAAEMVTGGNLDQRYLDAIGVLNPHFGRAQGRAVGPRMTKTTAPASRACPAWTSRTWIQVITGCPTGPTACPDTLSKPRPRNNTNPRSAGGRTSGRWPGPIRRGRSDNCGPGHWAAPGPACSEPPRQHLSFTLSDTAGQWRTRAEPTDMYSGATSG
jgi:hypothetical protein